MSLKCIVKIGGKNIAEIAPIDYIETFCGVNKIPYAIIRVRDWLKSSPNENLLMDDSAFKIGNDVSIDLGENDSAQNVFKGVVAKQSLKMDASIGICNIEIVAKDKANRLTIADHVANFKDKTDDEILKSIISGQGLSADVSGLSTKHESFTQYNMTDWDLINIRAESYGRIVLVENGKVSVVKPKNGGGNASATFGEDIISMDCEVNSDYQIEDATGKIWDIKNQKVKDVKSDSAAESSFGSIKYSDVTKAMNKPKSNFVHCGVNDENEVKNFISGTLALNRFSKIQGTLTIDGNNSLKPNTCIKIDKGTNVFQGNAYISGVKHIFDEEGWVTKVNIGLTGKRYIKQHNNVFNPDNNGLTSLMSGLRVGVVKKIDGDPEKQSRVFVNIPTIHENGSGVWCRMSSFYASNGIGGVFYPEVNDEVVVGFIESDPRYPIIVGSLYSPKNVLPVDQIKAENDIKTIRTKSKMEIKFQEKDKIITILTPGNRNIIISDKDKSIQLLNGSDKITITDGAIDVKCSKDITLDGKNITLKASGKISMKATQDAEISGNNIKIKGNMTAALEGSTSTTVKSSGPTVIKGALVNIN